jgi:hypothetical protein
MKGSLDTGGSTVKAGFRVITRVGELLTIEGIS